MRAGKVTPAMRVYNSKQWKTARRQAMHAAEYVCQAPGCSDVLVGPGGCHVHHRRRLQEAWSLAYEPANHRALCVPHHSIETNREIAAAKGKPERSGCDELGWPTSRSHPWFRN
jgi:5-methylcytosine-specific restriction endonuclease McrA